MENTTMNNIFAVCETMSLAELDAIYSKVGRLIDEKRIRRRDELFEEFIAAFRALRKEFPEVRMPVYFSTFCEECETDIDAEADILELMEDKFRLGY